MEGSKGRRETKGVKERRKNEGEEGTDGRTDERKEGRKGKTEEKGRIEGR